VQEAQVPEQEKQDAGSSGAREFRSSQALFTRPMPGGGSVRVELLVSDRGDIAGERLRGRVVMDDDAGANVAGGTQLIVEELEGATVDELLPELLRIARDNAAIARRVMRHRAEHERAD
jgi:hypothetical protein